MANGAILTINRDEISTMLEICQRDGYAWEVTERVDSLREYFAAERACVSVQFTEESLGSFLWAGLVRLSGEAKALRHLVKNLAHYCPNCYGTGAVPMGDGMGTCPACEDGRADWREYEAGMYARLLHIRELGGFQAEMRVLRYINYLDQCTRSEDRVHILARGQERLPEIRELHVKLGNEAGKLPGR